MIVEQNNTGEPEWFVECRRRFDQHVEKMLKHEREQIERRNRQLQEATSGRGLHSTEG